MKVGSIFFDESICFFIIYFEDWIMWYKNMKGDFCVMCCLMLEFVKNMKKGIYVFEFFVFGGVIILLLYCIVID